MGVVPSQPQGRWNTLSVMSMAMSQRTASHWLAMSFSVAMAAWRRPG